MAKTIPQELTACAHVIFILWKAKSTFGAVGVRILGKGHRCHPYYQFVMIWLSGQNNGAGGYKYQRMFFFISRL